MSRSSPHIGRLAVFAGVSDLPSRVKCAILPWHTLHAAFKRSPARRPKAMPTRCTRRSATPEPHAAHQDTAMPKIAEIEFTPNPNARKFILREPLTYGVSIRTRTPSRRRTTSWRGRCSRSRTSPTCSMSTTGSPSRRTARPTGSELLRELAVPICALRRRRATSRPATVAAATASFAHLSETLTRTASTTINQLLDEQIRPYLQGDGGDLHVLGLEGNMLNVHYQGACGSCPSSISGTLAGHREPGAADRSRDRSRRRLGS